jgi:hypothetical protein
VCTVEHTDIDCDLMHECDTVYMHIYLGYSKLLQAKYSNGHDVHRVHIRHFDTQASY